MCAIDRTHVHTWPEEAMRLYLEWLYMEMTWEPPVPIEEPKRG